MSFTDGVLYCTFQRTITPVQNEQNKVFDLDSVPFVHTFRTTTLNVQAYYMMSAYGDAIGSRTLGIHDLNATRPFVREYKTNLVLSASYMSKPRTKRCQPILATLQPALAYGVRRCLIWRRRMAA